ncbi:tetraspanin-9 [Anthonomus grandis grandis]|uniref:tetraspanin-9 n=1 Tax=Anthonomus grandis grandis TaxID=2921223 RepID=UPI0021654808|nr:tetraspanin-9 [Anthonomus grandis grandis]XP_050297923.1 tetraspanin-9 [Anthonomus grandis grandis]
MSSSGYTCIRTVFCFVNVLFWITGCVLLAVGIWLRISYEGFATLLPQYALLSADVAAIVIGLVTFILSFFACCGSWVQSRCMLITYFSLVVFMFVAEFIFGSLAFVYRDSIKHTFVEKLQDGLSHNYNISEPSNNLVGIWDEIQSTFRCCGVENYEDWHMIDAWPDQLWVPDTCCLPANYGVGCGQQRSDSIYKSGCYKKIYEWFKERLLVIGLVGLTVAFVQLFGLISSMLLFCTVKHRRRSRTYKSYQ